MKCVLSSLSVIIYRRAHRDRRENNKISAFSVYSAVRYDRSNENPNDPVSMIGDVDTSRDGCYIPKGSEFGIVRTEGWGRFLAK